MRKTFLPLLALLLFATVIFYGCGKDEGPKTKTAADLINDGWTKFDAGDFSGASGDFNAALGLDTTAVGAYLGLGWAELRQSHGGLAETAFLKYLSSDSVSIDAKAGLALAYLADDKFSDAIIMALAVLSANPEWTFRSTTINHLDLKLVIVQSYYEMADYAQSLDAIQEYFDATFNPGDLNTAEGRNALAEKIEELYTG